MLKDTSYRTYDELWFTTVAELKELMARCYPKDNRVAPRDLLAWTILYASWVSALQNLAIAFDRLFCPALRNSELRVFLLSCFGHALSLRDSLVQVGGGQLLLLDEALSKIKATPGSVELPLLPVSRDSAPQELKQEQPVYEQSCSASEHCLPAAQTDLPEPHQGIHFVDVAAEPYQPGQPEGPNNGVIRSGRQALDVSKLQSTDASISEADQQATKERKAMQARKEQEFAARRTEMLLKLETEEGPLIRKNIEDTIRNWFLEKRTNDDDNFPELPAESEGGSRAISFPVLSHVDASSAAQRGIQAQPGSRKAVKEPTAKQTKSPDLSRGRGDPKLRVEAPSAFLEDFQNAAAQLTARWQPVQCDSHEAAAFEEKMLRDDLLPLVEAKIRAEVDSQMRGLLHKLREDLAKEKLAIALRGPQSPKGTKIKGKAAAAPGTQKKGTEKPAPAKLQKLAKSSEKALKKPADLTAGYTKEALIQELTSSNILQQTPSAQLQDFVAAPDLRAIKRATSPQKKAASRGPSGKVAGPKPQSTARDRSLWELKQQIIARCVLPLSSNYLFNKAPHGRCVLLYGPKGVGKTSLAHIVAAESGAAWFDLSPRNTDGKFMGTNVNLMLRMVFKLARLLSPSVIYIEEVEKVFISDKRRQAAFEAQEPLNRIRKDLMREIAQLSSEDRILVIGHTSEPQACVKADQVTFSSLFDERAYVPLPDYACRRDVWQEMLKARNVTMEPDHHLSILTKLSEGWAPGDFVKALDAVCQAAQDQGVSPERSTLQALTEQLTELERASQEQIDLIEAWPPEVDIEQGKEKKAAK